MAELSEFRWVKAPRQARSQASLSRILDAAADVISRRGFQGATVAEIVRNAKSSVGVFYDRFQDKDALLDCLHQRFCDESYATAEEALRADRWKDASGHEIATTLTAFLVEIYRQQRGLLRVFVVRCATNSKCAQRGAEMMNYITERFASLLLEHDPAMRHPNPKFAVELGLRAVYSTLDSILIFEDSGLGTVKLDDPALTAELARMLLAYVGVSMDAKDAPPPRKVATKPRRALAAGR
jgi:AcrR family transcriptional regulator